MATTPAVSCGSPAMPVLAPKAGCLHSLLPSICLAKAYKQLASANSTVLAGAGGDRCRANVPGGDWCLAKCSQGGG